MRMKSFKCVSVFVATLMFFAGYVNKNTISYAESDFIVVSNISAGNFYLKSGCYSDALREFLSAQAKEPSNPDVAFGLIRCYAHMGEFDKAWTLLNGLESRRKEDMRIHLVKAEVLSIKGHTEEALQEFILLIEKGIYRFEALQGLIQLYVSFPDLCPKRLIDNTIALYEPVNQITLYEILVDNLSKNGRVTEAREYKAKLDSLLEAEPTRNAGAYSEISPLEWVVNRATRLIEQSSISEAADLLEDASMRWRGDERIQRLLKLCYLEEAQDCPLVE